MSWRSQRRENVRYVTAGFEFIATFGLPLAGGLLLDRHLGTLPGYTIFGGCIGFAVGLKRLIGKGREIIRQRRQGQAGSDDDAPPQAGPPGSDEAPPGSDD